jgi:hypothetical protein
MKLFKNMNFLGKGAKFIPLTSVIEEPRVESQGGGGDDDGETPIEPPERTLPPPPIPEKSPRVFNRGNNDGDGQQQQDPTANLFDQKFVPDGYPKMGFDTKKIVFKYPSKRVQKLYGHGLTCAYCFSPMIHNAPRAPKRPCLITSCNHIVCADCVTFNSRPLLQNMDPATFRQHPYIFGRLSSSGMECPACNKKFEWSDVYNFYL